MDEAKYQRVNLVEKIDSTLALLQYEFSHNNIKVVKQFKQIPEVFCYPNELNQVFMNILTNSIRAIENNGTITVRTFLKNKFVSIEFSDTGKGIPADKLNSLLDFNFTTKNTRIGVGMGLMSSYNVIQKHKGDMEIKSDVGKGTTVTITLPAA